MRLVIEEEEALIAPDRTAQRAAELVAVQPAHLGQEKVARVKHVVAPELEERPVKAVGPRLGDQTDLAEGGLSQLRRIGVGLNLELLNGAVGGRQADVPNLRALLLAPARRELILFFRSAVEEAGPKPAG